jgi:hypothetical protein
MVAVKKHIAIFLWAVFLLLSGCLDSYERTERTFDVQPFQTIRLKSVFSVVLRQANEYSVHVTADRDIIDEIKVEVNDAGVLELSNDARLKWTSPERARIQVTINSPYFQQFVADESYSLSTSGEITFDELFIINNAVVKISDVNLQVNGKYLLYWNNWLAGGKLELHGQVESLEAHNYALHLIDARDLHATNAIVHNFGRENCAVNVSGHFEYSLNGPGNIILYGNPSEVVLLEKTSSGQLITHQ